MKDTANKLLKEGYRAISVSKALGISRSSCYPNGQNANREQCGKVDDKHILERIRDITAQHPFWGYRRV